MKKRKYYLILLVALSVVTLSAQNQSGSSASSATSFKHPYHQYFGDTFFLNLSSIYDAIAAKEVMAAPPVPGSSAALADEQARTTTYLTASDPEIVLAVHEEDTVFSFSSVLGPNFNAEELPKTKALFEKVYHDAHLATDMAKFYFKRPRPMGNSGYSYPSAHSTRAYLWASLLITIFPQYQIALDAKASQKGEDRVILGRHYPDDVNAGEEYGDYLSNAFLQNPNFAAEWNQVVKEIKNKVNPSANQGASLVPNAG